MRRARTLTPHEANHIEAILTKEEPPEVDNVFTTHELDRGGHDVAFLTSAFGTRVTIARTYEGVAVTNEEDGTVIYGDEANVFGGMLMIESNGHMLCFSEEIIAIKII